VKQVIEHANKEEEPEPTVWADPDLLIPSGSTPLNCALSDSHLGGYLLGTIINTIGDSGTGKTLLALTILAEMSLYSKFDGYRFIFDDVEAALAGNIKRMFGTKVADRIELKIRSETTQDLYVNLLKAIKDGRPFIYIVDSLDALTSIEEQERGEAMLLARAKEERTGKKVKDPGSYKTEKPRLISEILRVTKGLVKERKSFINFISQTRDNLGWGFSDKTRAGGKALKFYCFHEMWVSSASPIKKLNETVGSHSRVKISKNKLTFKKRTVDVPIYDHYGIDEIGSSVDYLVKEERWKKDKQTIKATDFGWEGSRETIIKRIERGNEEIKLSELVGEVWTSKEKALEPDRKPRYE
jgi:recombination protein RecA